MGSIAEHAALNGNGGEGRRGGQGPQLGRADVCLVFPGSSFITQVPKALPRPRTRRPGWGLGICILQQWCHHHSINVVNQPLVV